MAVGRPRLRGVPSAWRMARAPELARTGRVKWPGWGHAPTLRFPAATGPTLARWLPRLGWGYAALRPRRSWRRPRRGCLIGDHGGARVQFPPSYRARLLADEGIPGWAGINCRDRNRVAIEGEIAACVDAGVVGLHCVTGDHPSTGHRPDAQPVFDLDCVEVIELARPSGALCSAAHAPAAAPAEHRLARLLAKIGAGAEAVFVDHCGGPSQLGDAVAELRGCGFDGSVLACVPIVTGPATAAVISSFAGDRLPRATA